jgi:hypothetical protein
VGGALVRRRPDWSHALECRVPTPLTAVARAAIGSDAGASHPDAVLAMLVVFLAVTASRHQVACRRVS